jgi:hypothetical protein
MKNIFNFFINSRTPKTKVAIIYIATGPYITFWKEFYKNFNNKFCPNTHLDFFLFTNQTEIAIGKKNVFCNYIEHEPWPYITLKRFEFIESISSSLKEYNYIFFCNSNLICKDKIYLDDLGLFNMGKLGFVQHPEMSYKPRESWPVENNIIESNAYLEKTSLNSYVQGCFYGGGSGRFLEMIQILAQWTKEDLSNDIIPIWHDESYLNKYVNMNSHEYFINIISPAFSYPENSRLPFRIRIIQKLKGQEFKNFKRGI